MRLLLVEDDPRNAEYFVAVLEADGHSVALERHGASGRSRALRETFDVIVLDIHLPGVTGDAICRDLRGAGVATPVVGVSASAMKEQIQQLASAGFDAFLTKPVSPAALRDALRRFGPTGLAS